MYCFLCQYQFLEISYIFIGIKELFQTRDHKNELNDIDISLSLKMAASCGDNT